MTESEIVEYLRSLPSADVQTIAEGSEVPEAAWGSTFASVGVGGGWGQQFATVVTRDQPGEPASGLDAPGRFRLNVGVGRERFEQLLGFAPEQAATRAASTDPAVTGVLVAHPTYAAQGWVSITCPSDDQAEELQELIRRAHERSSSS